MFLMGPDFDEEDVAETLKQLTDLGINITALGAALPSAVIDAVEDMAEDDRIVWKQTLPAALVQAVSA